MPIRFSCFPLQITFLLNKFAFLFRYQTETDKSFLTLKYWNQNRFENLKTDQLFSKFIGLTLDSDTNVAVLKLIRIAFQKNAFKVPKIPADYIFNANIMLTW